MELNSTNPTNLTNFGVVLVTVPSLAAGKAIAQALLKDKLAACVNIFPVTSLYLWQSEINEDQEYQLLIKTNLDNFEQLVDRVQTLHDYEVPEIIALPIVAGSQSYLAWLSDSVGIKREA